MKAGAFYVDIDCRLLCDQREEIFPPTQSTVFAIRRCLGKREGWWVLEFYRIDHLEDDDERF